MGFVRVRLFSAQPLFDPLWSLSQNKHINLCETALTQFSTHIFVSHGIILESLGDVGDGSNHVMELDMGSV